MNRKFHIIYLVFFLTALCANAQSFDEDRIVLSNFIERLYNNAPFEGCRILDDYDNSYLLSVVVLDPTKYKVSSAMNRVAQVKSQRNAGEFFNGTQSYSELTIKTPKGEKTASKNDMVETIEVIKVNSTGFVQQMQLLTTFEDKNHLTVFIFYKELTLPTKSKEKMVQQ